MEETTNWQRLPTIDTERFRLRWMEDRDVPQLFDIFSHGEVTRFWAWPAFDHIAKAEKLLHDIRQSFAERRLFQWGIATRDEDRVIGTCTLAHVDLGNGRAELGFALHRERWGNGVMQEVLPALIRFAFERLALRRLEADVDPRNDRSLRLLEKLGFVREGLLRERWHVNGEIQDAAFYGLLAREWSPQSLIRPAAV